MFVIAQIKKQVFKTLTRWEFDIIIFKNKKGFLFYETQKIFNEKKKNCESFQKNFKITKPDWKLKYKNR